LIRVRLVGHVKTSVGRDEIELPDESMDAGAIVDRVREMSREPNPGFNRYNTLAMVEDGEAFLPAAESRTVRSGEKVVIIPFSHGG
jgi:molybdopterin converting factor small subunit